MINEPKSIVCTLIDGLEWLPGLSRFGRVWSAGVHRSTVREWIWHSPIYDRNNILKQNNLLDFPLVIPDVDGDGVKDLFFITSFEATKHNKFVMIYGRKGDLLATLSSLRNVSTYIN